MKIRVYSDLHLYINVEDIDRYDSTELLDLKDKLITDPVDMLVFCGDLTHKVYSTDDIRFVNTMKFVASIRDICNTTNTIFRIIKGTSTHEGKIIEVLQEMYEGDPILKCFTEVAYEQINNLVFRYLPEPYFDNYTNFYTYAFSRVADITFFHGTIDGVLPFLKQTDNPTNLPKSVLMKSEDFITNTNLFSVGGHIHKYINIANKIFYTNSLTTHGFADVNNIKGFMEFTIDNEKNWDYKYIKNNSAPNYYSIEIENIHTKRKEDLQSILGNTLLKLKSYDKIRFILTGDRDINAMSNIHFLRNLTKKYSIKIEQKLEEVEDYSKMDEESDFFSDNNISIEDKISRLVEERYGLKLTNEEIRKVIT